MLAWPLAGVKSSSAEYDARHVIGEQARHMDEVLAWLEKYL
jgi:hypothetical protein